jgi:hypothetical protein
MALPVKSVASLEEESESSSYKGNAALLTCSTLTRPGSAAASEERYLRVSLLSIATRYQKQSVTISCVHVLPRALVMLGDEIQY